VEVLPQILPVEDAEIAALARKSFEKQGIKILTNAKSSSSTKRATASPPSSRRAANHRPSGPSASFRRSAWSATSRISDWKSSASNRTCIIIVDQFNKTNLPASTLSATCAALQCWAHKAEHEGVVCIEAIKGLHPHPMNKLMIPGCTYCSPQIASVGLTEQARGRRSSTSASATSHSWPTARQSRS